MPLLRRRLSLIGSAIAIVVVFMVADSDRRDYYNRLPPVGTAVPDFDLPMIGEGTLTAETLRGHPAVLALWSTDCSASRLALEGLAGVQETYAETGLIVAVLANDADAEALATFMEGAGVDLPAAYASGELHALFDHERRPWQKSFPLPSYLVLDSTGQILAVSMGVPLDDVQTGSVKLQHLRAAIDRVL